MRSLFFPNMKSLRLVRMTCFPQAAVSCAPRTTSLLSYTIDPSIRPRRKDIPGLVSILERNRTFRVAMRRRGSA